MDEINIKENVQINDNAESQTEIVFSEITEPKFITVLK